MSTDSLRSKPIVIIIVDDHQVLTDALTIILRSQPDLQVAGVAATCAATREALARTCPDVLLLDISLPDGDGLSLVPDVKRLCPETHVLVLTSASDEKTLMRAIDSGVNGFVMKTRPLSEVIGAIRQAAEGEIVMPTGLMHSLLGRMAQARGTRADQPGSKPLTPREREILTCLARGMSGPGIAAALNIAPLTAKTHIRNVLEKMGVHSRLEAVALALRHGLIEPPI